ncbi:hypothetical protein AQ490_04370 [Wenjunlia vitaminophila]|uniref:Uncharacterized protein n=1 Tax=Wenjunlia vitaminophila TaxID=76728 RepID=A0A0T6LPG0_WENVI|nr:hypothetical protein [Wenjunlia vitaminophila]KRV47958.1 hypothetical protein AQ490_04370 [Wenjunlia vitaminophila]
MPLHTPPAPDPALHAVLTALDSPAATRATPALHGTTGPVSTSHPHPVHVLPSSATHPAALATTRRIGWRFLINAGDTPVATAETLRTADGWAFSHFSQGPFATSTFRALTQAHALPATYQPRLLSVPALYMLALWLHQESSPDCAGDLLVPLAPAPPGITAHRPHLASDLLPALSPRPHPDPALLTSPV